MTRVPIAGWRVSLEAAIRATAAAYDVSRYDNREVYAETAPATGWLKLDEWVQSTRCSYGAARGQAPSMVATAGRLDADLYDPERQLDPVLTTYPDLLEPGAPIRLVARKDGAERPLWTGTVRKWWHDTLTGAGRIEAVDAIARIAPVPLVDLQRPAETTPERLAAMLAAMPGAPELVATGTGRTLCAATLSGDLWQAMRSVVDTDQSWLWADAAGRVRWQARGRADTATAQFLDWPDPATPDAAVYVGLPTASDDDAIVNTAAVQRIHPAGQEQPPPRLVVRSGSRDRHAPHTYRNTDLQLATDLEVDQWAEQLLRLRAWPIEGPVELKAIAHDDLEWAGPTMDAVTALGLADVVRVRLATRGPVQEWLCVVGSVELLVTMDTLTATLRLALPEEVGVGGYDAPTTRYDSTSVYDGTVPRRARRRARKVYR